eukprot:6189377-Pleurochrysis_carterae.AAC.4
MAANLQFAVRTARRARLYPHPAGPSRCMFNATCSSRLLQPLHSLYNGLAISSRESLGMHGRRSYMQIKSA